MLGRAQLLGTSTRPLPGLANILRRPRTCLQRTWRERGGRRGAVLPSAISAPPERPATRPVIQRPPPTQPSGQPASWAYGSPMCGKPEPLGATIDPSTGATNFALFSGSSWSVNLVLFTEDDLVNGRSTLEVPLDPLLNRTGDTWHVMLPDLDSKLLYGFRVAGPNQETEPGADGHRFSESRVVLDPYAKAIFSRRHYGEMGRDLPYGTPGVLGAAATWPQMAAAVPQRTPSFDWEGDRPLNLPIEDLVIYEMHVRGFTRHGSSGVSSPGTFAGVIEKLDYLRRLGVNAIELMPIQEFNELEYYQIIPGTGNYRFNMWGYSTVGFFAPMSRYSAAAAHGGSGEDVLNEFRQLVKESHKRGIEVILDVVFNHTAEGNEMGPTLSFRGLDNRVFYMLAPAGQYYNYSGCGNTLNCNHPVVRQFIVDCLKYWVTEMHVDGFRFDLGSILTRAHSQWHKTQPVPPGTVPTDAPVDGAIPGEPMLDGHATSVAPFSGGAIVDENGIMTDGAGVPTGTPLTDPPLIEMISEDPVLRHTKLIAEAWDCDGLNQVGAFPHYGRWSEWNGHFRDTVRQFIKGTDGPWVGNFASVLCGSPHIYLHEPGPQDWWGNNGGRRWKGGRGPAASINFVTAHDGFTLADLVSYNEKHNEANGENNRDGESHNLSWNCGEEGSTSAPPVLALRQRQMRNMMAALLLGHGVPMFYMGDEYGHSKGGNNNTYCHDSELNWLNWEQAERDERGLQRFTRHMIALRKSLPELRRQHYVGGEMEWHGVVPNAPDWSDSSRFLAFSMRTQGGEGSIYVAFNTSHLPQMVALPQLQGRMWQQVVDSGKVAPYDVLRADEQLSQEQVDEALGAAAMWTLQHVYPMLPWSAVVLESVPYDQATAAVLRGKAATGTAARPGGAGTPAFFAPAPGTPPRGAEGGSGSWGWGQMAAASAAAAPTAQAVAADVIHDPAKLATSQPSASAAASAPARPTDKLSAAKKLAALIAGKSSIGGHDYDNAEGVHEALVHPPLASSSEATAGLHTSGHLPTDVPHVAAAAWHGPPQEMSELQAEMSEEDRRLYEEMIRENERLRRKLGLEGAA